MSSGSTESRTLNFSCVWLYIKVFIYMTSTKGQTGEDVGNPGIQADVGHLGVTSEYCWLYHI